MFVRTLLAMLFGLLVSAASFASDPWLYSGRIGGTFVYNAMSDADLEALLDQRVAQNVSILEVDSQLSYNLSDQDNSVDLTLVASDVDGDSLSYTIVNQPQQGSLSGTAPELTYQPAAGFTGTDSFNFQVSDGVALSRIATVSLTVQTPDQSEIPGNAISLVTVDGITDEWQSVRYFDDDPDDVSGEENPVDFLRAAMAHDAGFYYLTFTNDGQNLTQLQDWLFTVYIDTDSNAATGYQSGLAIGADVMQQAGAVHSYSGTGEDWTWTPLAVTPRAASGSSVEIAIPRQAIGDPTELRFVMIGDNLSIGGGVEDVYPDGTYNSTAAIRYLSYTSEGTASEPVALAAVDSSIVPISGRQALMQNATEITRQPDLETEKKSDDGGAIGFGILPLLGIAAFRRRASRLAL